MVSRDAEALRSGARWAKRDLFSRDAEALRSGARLDQDDFGSFVLDGKRAAS